MEKDVIWTVRRDEARSNLGHLLDSVEHEGAHVTVLRYNRPGAVIVPVDWYEQAVAEFGRERPEPYPASVRSQL